MNIIRFLVAIVLVPVCVAATDTLASLVACVSPSGPGIPLAVWPLVGGFLLWLVIYFTLPRPVRAYVLAHELTHALWAKLWGARVFSVQVSRQSGSVAISKSNFLIVLAPYFFPFYTVLVILAYLVAGIFVDVESYYPYWLAVVGLTWGFHVTFTVVTLLQRQSDIREYGHFFSYMVIYLMNVMGVCLWVVGVSAASLEQMLGLLQAHTQAVFLLIWPAVTWAIARLRQQ